MQIVEPSATMLWVTPEAEKFIEEAGRTCYKSEEKITDESASSFIRGIIKSGHESVLEHASASFRIVTNRYTTHQIVRHRLFSYSQESQRYCNYSKEKFGKSISFVLPMYEKMELYRTRFINRSIIDACDDAECAYNSLIKNGAAPQVARSVLPSSCKTEIVMTGNFRSWRHFFKLRCSTHAQIDVRFLANEMRSQLENVAPSVFGETNE